MHLSAMDTYVKSYLSRTGKSLWQTAHRGVAKSTVCDRKSSRRSLNQVHHDQLKLCTGKEIDLATYAKTQTQTGIVLMCPSSG